MERYLDVHKVVLYGRPLLDPGGHQRRIEERGRVSKSEHRYIRANTHTCTQVRNRDLRHLSLGQVQKYAVAMTFEGQGDLPEEGLFTGFTGQELPHVRLIHCHVFTWSDAEHAVTRTARRDKRDREVAAITHVRTAKCGQLSTGTGREQVAEIMHVRTEPRGVPLYRDRVTVRAAVRKRRSGCARNSNARLKRGQWASPQLPCCPVSVSQSVMQTKSRKEEEEDETKRKRGSVSLPCDGQGRAAQWPGRCNREPQSEEG